MPEEEEGFSFVDKRGAAADAADSAPTAGVGDNPEPPEDAEAEGDHPRLAARDRLLMCIDILHQGAWIALGLVTDPVTSKVEQDLNEARLQIDSVSDLVDKVIPLVDESIQRDLRALVSTLRVNFVNQSRRQSS